MNAKLALPDKIEGLLNDPLYVAEVKIDGYRCVYEDHRFHSRLGNDLSDKLQSILGQLHGFDVTLDGELYIPGGNSSDVTTALGKDGDKSKLRYCVYDILSLEGTSLMNCPWTVRRATLEDFFAANLWTADLIDLSEVYPDKFGLRTLDESMDYIVSHGVEGFMLKNTAALYYPDKRPTNVWWKVKKHDTADVVVMNYEDGKGKYKGLIGSVVFGMYDGDTLVECGKCSGFTDDMRKDITKHQKHYIGCVMEIGYMERTKDLHFRHPVFKGFRDDKAPKACQLRD
jgi:ATP-dependent DNA ligase